MVPAEDAPATGDEDDALDLACLPVDTTAPLKAMDMTAGQVPSLVALEIHVVWSASYCVPLLFFTARRGVDGALLPLESVWRLVPHPLDAPIRSGDRWSFLTQAEHPLLGVPFFHVHPCATSEAMTQLTGRLARPVLPSSYLVSWLSLVLPLVGVHVPHDIVAAICSPAVGRG